jgi:hypothetical protein
VRNSGDFGRFAASDRLFGLTRALPEICCGAKCKRKALSRILIYDAILGPAGLPNKNKARFFKRSCGFPAVQNKPPAARFILRRASAIEKPCSPAPQFLFLIRPR